MNESLMTTEELIEEQIVHVTNEMSVTNPASEEYRTLECTLANLNKSLIDANRRKVETYRALEDVKLEKAKVNNNKKSWVSRFGNGCYELLKVALPVAITGGIGLLSIKAVSDHEDEEIYGRTTEKCVNDTYRNIFKK